MGDYWASFRKMGPAWVVSAVACGPATLASVSIAGSTFGYSLLWVVILSAILATVSQYLAAKTGILGQGGVIHLVDVHLGTFWGWVLTVDALLATWLAAVVLMKALAGTTSLVTGLSTPFWGIPYAFFFFFLLIVGGYKRFELFCKLLVGVVVLCFVITLAIVKPDIGPILEGLVPTIPPGIDSAVMMAGIMGGAVHITIIAMHTYTVNARKWTIAEMGLARFDTIFSMFFAFGLYSVSIFLAAAAVLHPKGIQVKSALDVAMSLAPLVGKHGQVIFLIGLLAAVVSTIAPTYLAGGYFLSDKLHWAPDVKDTRFRLLIALGCGLSVLGPFLKGSFIFLLVLMLALGLCGTPLVLVLIMVLLNRRSFSGERKNPMLLNILGGAAVAVTTFLAARFILMKLGVWIP
jgi:manganese transport protein